MLAKQCQGTLMQVKGLCGDGMDWADPAYGTCSTRSDMSRGTRLLPGVASGLEQESTLPQEVFQVTLYFHPFLDEL